MVNLFHDNFGFLKSKNIVGRTQWRTLHKMLSDNSVSKVKRGLYRLNDYYPDTLFAEVSYIVPNGVLCSFSAWFFYNLTTTIPHTHHIAVMQKNKVSLPDYPPIKLYYLTDKFYQLGLIQINIENQPVKIYDLEKSVCDAVRFRNKVGLDVAFEVTKNYLKRNDRDLNKLSIYAKQLRIEKIIQNMIMPML